MADYAIAKAFKRKVGFDEELISKIHGKREGVSLLMNPQRRLIFQYICNLPCSHLRGISKAINFSTQTVRWHLNKLRDAELITETSHGKKKLYHPLKDIITLSECRVLSLLNDDTKRRTYIYIRNNPKKTQKELCTALNTYQQLLSNNLMSLEKHGLITSGKKAKKKAYTSTDRINELFTDFDLRKSGFEKALMDALTKDNLNPKLKSSRANILLIKLDILDSKQNILKVNRNPFWALSKGIQTKKIKP
jgi:predicted transcriptional regulator